MYFVENDGQLDPRVALYLHGRDTSVYFTDEGITFGFVDEGERWVVGLDFVGAAARRPVGLDPTPAVVSYFKGRPSEWNTALRTYARVVYEDLWPGIDLVYGGTESRIKYTFLLEPGADPGNIRLAYRGATDVRLTDSGRLRVTTPLGSFEDDEPYAYQDVGGKRVDVDSAFVVEDDSPEGAVHYRFHVGSYDRTRSLVLDPVIFAYCGYIGGSGGEEGEAVALDGFGNAYVVGSTGSSAASFPETVGPDLTFGAGFADGFIAKVNVAGSALVYAGYIGGSGIDDAQAVAVDSAGNAYVGGDTFSDEATFPVSGGPDLTYNGGGDAYVVKIDASGTAFVYGGYIGGSGQEETQGLAVDDSGALYVTGNTDSTEAQSFPLVGGLDATYNGGTNDAFVTKVNAAGTGLVYSGYVGGSGGDIAHDIAIDGSGNAYIAGQTAGGTFPAVVGPDLTFAGGSFDGFVSKVNASGSALVYSGFVGGSASEDALGVAVDPFGNAYLTGWTTSTAASFPVAVGPDLTQNGSTDAFVARVNAAGTGFDYAGYIGGSAADSGNDIAVDAMGNVFVTGDVSSTPAQGFPVSVGPDLTHGGGQDAFVAKVNAGGASLGFTGYIGGSGTDSGRGVAVTSDGGNVYVTGQTDSTEANFPVTVGPDVTQNGSEDAFIARIEDTSIPTVNLRSIGIAADYTTGTASATFGSATVTGAGTMWQTANRGRGDRIELGANNYTILSVDSETSLTLTQPATASYSGAYTIARQFAAFQAWGDCITFAAACPFFPVASSDMVADKRSEIGIAYNDSIVPADPDFTQGIDLNSVTTDADHTITLTADGDNRHYGVPGAGVLLDCSTCTLTNEDEILIDQVNNVVIEWLELTESRLASNTGAIRVFEDSTNVLLQYLLIHDNWNGIRTSGIAGKNVTVRNSIIYNNDDIGIEGDEAGDVLLVENCTVYGHGVAGIDGDLASPTVTVRNTISMNNATDFLSIGTQANNISEDGTAAGGGSLTGRSASDNPTPAAGDWVLFQSLTPGSEDFHLIDNAAENDAMNNASDLSASFTADIDGGSREVPWDVGADDVAATTAVELLSFEVRGLEGAVELTWETGSELDNLGFHLYRAGSEGGPYLRITAAVIPGLGSSPEGKAYSYRDSDVSNGQTYFYELEDIETTGGTERHGPRSATPQSGAPSDEPVEETPVDERGASLITYGDPTSNTLRVLKRTRSHMVIELVTEGFYAERQDDGTVKLSAPEFVEVGEPGAPGVPVRRQWFDAVVGRKVQLRRVRASGVSSVEGLRLSNVLSPDIAASRAGTVRATLKRVRASKPIEGVYPPRSSRLVEVGFQGDGKKALLELAPLRWDSTTGRLFLTRRLVVRLSFRGVEPGESTAEGRGRRRRDRGLRMAQTAAFRLVTHQAGLHALRYEELFGRRRGRRYAMRLSRRGEEVAYHLEPSRRTFGPGSTLYFVSEGAAANPYGNEAVYELSFSRGRQMAEADAAPTGVQLPYAWQRLRREEDRLYQAALLEAPDLWLWDVLLSRSMKNYDFEVSALAASSEPAQLSVWLQGATDLSARPDHHVRLYVNGSFVGEVSFDGKKPQRLDASLAPGSLRTGSNHLQLENVGDTGAAYSMVMLDKFEVIYPQVATTSMSQLKAHWHDTGTARVAGATMVLDVTGDEPVWLGRTETDPDGRMSFRAEEGRRYLALGPDALLRPRLQPVVPTTLRRRGRRTDYLVIGPRSFLAAAAPLLSQRASQGLRVRAVSVEEIVSEFGFGEKTPEAIQRFIAYAYHEWKQPSVRYVLLLGDATYDPKDRLGTGEVNHVPSPPLKTSYLWTVSDVGYAAVNGDDGLPDIAVGRLPASSEDEVRDMVSKILAYESGEWRLGEEVVLVADNPDAAGDFVANAEELKRGVLAGLTPETVYLSQLGASGARRATHAAFDGGSSLMSYLGHGGIHLWASEQILNNDAVSTLSPQARQPILLTMNCLNGYFHFPYFDSLSEELLKREDKGVVAAVSPSGLSLDAPAHRFHEALLSELLHGGHARLGDALVKAQETYAETGVFPELLNIYHLFGDPALQLR